MKVSTKKGEKMEEESFIGVMDHIMMVFLKIIISMERGYIYG